MNWAPLEAEVTKGSSTSTMAEGMSSNMSRREGTKKSKSRSTEGGQSGMSEGPKWTERDDMWED